MHFKQSKNITLTSIMDCALRSCELDGLLIYIVTVKLVLVKVKEQQIIRLCLSSYVLVIQPNPLQSVGLGLL